MYVCSVYICMYVCVFVCMYVVYVYMYVCMYVVYIYLYVKGKGKVIPLQALYGPEDRYRYSSTLP